MEVDLVPASFSDSPKRQEREIAKCKKHAESLGGLFLSEVFTTKKAKYVWRCKLGHEWNSSVESVVRMGTWCPICAGNRPRSLNELSEICKKRGGKVLSSVYKNVDATYDFECSKGHVFSNSFKHIENGQWCPTCNKGSKSEEIARTVFEHVFNEPFPKKRPKWLRNSRNRQMEFDGFCEKIKIAFEYQGIQHFAKSIYGESTEQRIADDATKVKLAEKHGVSLFILTHEMDYEDFVKEIQIQYKKFKLNVPANFSPLSDFDAAYIRDDRMLELKELLSPKNIEVLSKKWIAVDTLYQFRCLTCGHEWTAKGNHFFNSRRIGGCKKCAMQIRKQANLGNLEDIRLFSNKHGGTVISTIYTKRNAKYVFRCSVGHVFERNFNNMSFRNDFCPTCKKEARVKRIKD